MTRQNVPKFDLNRESITQLLDILPLLVGCRTGSCPRGAGSAVSYAHDGNERLAWPECGCKSPEYDHRERRWCDLDNLDYQTGSSPNFRFPDIGVGFDQL
ncbi:MAG: hypothetical protein OXC82_04885 [Rhodobacteraceae bacterium]|nr:hypothetical protein [Paracoccaceae bacterium]MCY4249756.1 hypothetical protein [Paracoccaceae bacterium]MCY4306784.1 hypothetical protein [Paracoccaceae bacterium]